MEADGAMARWSPSFIVPLKPQLKFLPFLAAAMALNCIGITTAQPAGYSRAVCFVACGHIFAVPSYPGAA